MTSKLVLKTYKYKQVMRFLQILKKETNWIILNNQKNLLIRFKILKEAQFKAKPL